MAERSWKKAVRSAKTTDLAQWLPQALASRTKGRLIDVLVKLSRDDGAVFRRVMADLKLQTPPRELVAVTRQALADATAFDEREVNHNLDYDDEAYDAVRRNLSRLIELGEVRAAMELSLELMDKGSYQVEMSDEGLMTEDIEACFRPVLEALAACDLPTAEVIGWCAEMIRRDRVGFLCDRELATLRGQFEASRSP